VCEQLKMELEFESEYYLTENVSKKLNPMHDFILPNHN
jgi:hypothetical protein